MYTVKLFNDVFHGPIWVIGDNGVVKLHYPLITEDKVLKSLSDEAGLLFASFTSEDLYDFDKAGYKAAYPKMKELVNKIIKSYDIADGKCCHSNSGNNIGSRIQRFVSIPFWRNHHNGN